MTKIERVLTKAGVPILRYFAQQDNKHYANINTITEAIPLSYNAARPMLYLFTAAGILRECRIRKEVVFMRNPNSNFLATFQELTEQIEKE